MIPTDTPARLTTLPVSPLVAFTILVVGSVAACALMMSVLVMRRRSSGRRTTLSLRGRPSDTASTHTTLSRPELVMSDPIEGDKS
ncbi:hypothetical protein LQ424_29585 [Rhodococcus qingshengii]|uniref:hypothetical protein n=1 Tax=Rhodococcus qingshengii TaxID=334542 RepID=UPI001E5F2D72|nr:hypothetical protein [Rhodococcus qingshengii]MCD2135978.1 hypothetical protein [Rhodococcus qingshengii]